MHKVKDNIKNIKQKSPGNFLTGLYEINMIKVIVPKLILGTRKINMYLNYLIRTILLTSTKLSASNL